MAFSLDCYRGSALIPQICLQIPTHCADFSTPTTTNFPPIDLQNIAARRHPPRRLAPASCRRKHQDSEDTDRAQHGRSCRMQQRTLTVAHWGVYEVEYDAAGKAVHLHPFSRDPDPSPI